MIDWYRLRQKDGEIPGESMERETRFINLVHSDEKNG
jgi:hypothetical protein